VRKYPNVLFNAPDGQPFIGFLKDGVCMALLLGTDQEYKIHDLHCIDVIVRTRVISVLIGQIDGEYGKGDEREDDEETMHVRRGRW
jgi:hypothetical protein